MSEATVTLHWKLTALVKPNDGQECVIYNPCDGYRVAEWVGDDQAFWTHAEPVSDQLAVFWMELPDTKAMCEMEQHLASHLVSVIQITEREKPAILQAI